MILAGRFQRIRLRQLKEQFTVSFIELSGNPDLDNQQHITLIVTVKTPESFSPQPQDFSGLGSRRDFHFNFTMQIRNLDCPAEHSIRYRNPHRLDQVVTVPFKTWMIFFIDYQ